VTKFSTLAVRHGAITVASTCERSVCRGSANLTVARAVKGSTTKFTHLVLAKATFDLRKGERTTLRLKLTALGRKVLKNHEGFWLSSTHHYRMTFTTKTIGGATIRNSVNLRGT
jgi:hypothetical protein